jgi:predicted ATPase/ATP/maltotriose-dependent transcriptional regulator MalT
VHNGSLSNGEKEILSNNRFSLPVQLTSFVGREQEIAAVSTLLRQAEVRLITLIGTGGVGKTRLGLRVAAQLAREFDNQVCFVSLMETSDPKLMIPTIAKTFGLQELGGQPIFDLLKAFLREKHLLLLLDNFEQVIEAAPALSHLLSACSALKILVTSRARLRISGEQTFLVPPLTLPNPGEAPEKDELAQYSAITLFLERARTVLPGFVLNEENGRVIAEICHHLDGLPLAIELAVPRLKIFTPQTLLERLAQRFQLLTNGVRDAPERQQTLHNTLEWSYRLLNPQEQQLFRALSIFVGGCTLQAIEMVCELNEHFYEKEAILEGVTSLLDKSMLSCSTQEAEEPRLFLLSTLREYGLQHLALTGELEHLQRAHAMYYLALAEEAELGLKGSQQRMWLDRLQREHENLREVFSHLIAYGEQGEVTGTEMALRLGKALDRFWVIGRHMKEGQDLLERALKGSQGVPPSLRGEALCVFSTQARYLGNYHYAIVACEESLAIFRELDDPSGIVNSLYRLGYVAWMRGDHDTARTYYEESLARSQGEQCQEARGETLYYFAAMTLFQGEVAAARPIVEESLDLFRTLGDQYNVALALNLLGWVLLFQEDIAAARMLQEESLTLSRELGNQRCIAYALGALGEVASLMGDYVQARERYEESLSNLLRRDAGWMSAIYMARLAAVAVAQNEAIWAVHLLSAAEALRQRMGVLRTTPLEREAREQTLYTLHELLDEPIFASAWVEGQNMSPEEAIVARRGSTQTIAPLKKQPTMKGPSSRSLHDKLTQREREVLRLVAMGLTNIQVAEHLVMSPRTVDFHLTSVYRKLEVASRSAATRYALEHHLFEE